MKWATVAVVAVVLALLLLQSTLSMFSVIGVVPLAFALSEGSEQRAPMVVVPVVYCCMDDRATWLKGKWTAKRPVMPLSPPKI